MKLLKKLNDQTQNEKDRLENKMCLNRWLKTLDHGERQKIIFKTSSEQLRINKSTHNFRFFK